MGCPWSSVRTAFGGLRSWPVPVAAADITLYIPRHSDNMKRRAASTHNPLHPTLRSLAPPPHLAHAEEAKLGQPACFISRSHTQPKRRQEVSFAVQTALTIAIVQHNRHTPLKSAYNTLSCPLH